MGGELFKIRMPSHSLMCILIIATHLNFLHLILLLLQFSWCLSFSPFFIFSSVVLGCRLRQLVNSSRSLAGYSRHSAWPLAMSVSLISDSRSDQDVTQSIRLGLCARGYLNYSAPVNGVQRKYQFNLFNYVHFRPSYSVRIVL